MTSAMTTKRSSSRSGMSDALTWYNNEMGYTHTLVEHVVKAGNA